jgi:hypothetical protein
MSSSRGGYGSQMPPDMSPVQQMIEALLLVHPTARVERLAVAHPSDDDNLWVVSEAGHEVQFDCHPGGLPPFLIEDDDGAQITAHDVAEGVSSLTRLLNRER